ncbi:hypothetical protein [Streptomyces sp. NPDC126514]|uniref:hypothetical protein n=1 Tax=Streptomyces sp. NPDC126514 TaxID=3155210 RepID=UPI00332C68BB
MAAHWGIDGDPIHRSLQPGSADLVTCRAALSYLQYERLLADVGRWLRSSVAHVHGSMSLRTLLLQ